MSDDLHDPAPWDERHPPPLGAAVWYRQKFPGGFGWTDLRVPARVIGYTASRVWVEIYPAGGAAPVRRRVLAENCRPRE